MQARLTKQDCIDLLVRKYAELGGTRYPKRADFTEREVVAIKAHLGPWPRALEAAGVKPVRTEAKIHTHAQSKRAQKEDTP